MTIRPELRRETTLTMALVLLAVAYPVAIGSVYWVQIALLACLYVIAATGVNILRSEAGQITFGHGAVFGASAYGTAMAAGIGGLPFGLAAIVGFVVGILAGVLLALPSLRVQGYYLGFVTMAGALAFPQLLFVFADQTQALTGISVPVPSLTIPVLWHFDSLTLITVAFTCGSVALYAVIRSSRLGRQMRVAGSSPEAAQTLGLHPGRLRLLAFAIASVITAVAGVLYVPLIQYVAPGSFSIDLSVLLYFVVVIGGPGTILGPLFGVALLYVLPNAVLADVGEYRLLIYGAIAFVVMFILPEGVVGSLTNWITRLRKRDDARANVSLAPVLAVAASQPAKTTDDQIVLDAEHLTRSFGSVKALDDVSFRVQKAQIHGIVGPNGSGKTTLLNSLSGLIRLDAGTVVLGGQDVSGSGPVHRARLGMARTFQAPRIFGDLSVWENLEVGRARDHDNDWLDEGLDAVRAEWDRTPGGVLPHAQQRFLEVIRVLRQGPSLLVLDEPAAGLTQTERREFGKLLTSVVTATGASIVIVEHDLELVWQIADVISVVDSGRVVLTGTPAELRNHSGISHLFAGVQNA